MRIHTALHLSSLKNIEFQDVLPCRSLSEKSIKISDLSVLLRTSQVLVGLGGGSESDRLG